MSAAMGILVSPPHLHRRELAAHPAAARADQAAHNRAVAREMANLGAGGGSAAALGH